MLVNGLLGDHGAAILCARGDMALETPIESDCAPLHGLIAALLAAAPGVRFVRDATRGGAGDGAQRDRGGVAGRDRDRRDARRRIREEVKAFCEILGLDPLYLANEGKIVVDRAAERGGRGAGGACAPIRSAKRAAIVGRVHAGEPGRVTMRTVFGGRRIVDMLVGEQLPRIC